MPTVRNLNNTKIKIRRDTKDAWLSTNPIIADGELVVEKPEILGGPPKIKIGDGLTNYDDLPSLMSNISDVTVNGKLLFGDVVLYSGKLTDGHVLVANGSYGEYTDSGFTLEKSVPANAVFTDTVTRIKADASSGTLVSGDITLQGSGATSVSQNGTTFTISSTNTTYSAVTTSKDGLMISSDKSKLDGIEAGAQVNVQSDWEDEVITSKSYIKNKPAALPASDVYDWAKAATKPSYTKSEVGLGNVDNTADSSKNVLSATKLTTGRSITLSGDATGSVVFDGSANVSIVATVVDNSHNHTIANITSLQDELDDKAILNHKHVKADITDFPTLATVATSGSYTDLINIPSTFTPAAHNQASSTINALTGYAKPSATSALATTDTLNSALGKLEKALDGKQPTGAYLTGNQTITLSGGATGSGTTSIAVTITDNSHKHTIANITSLQDTLNSKVKKYLLCCLMYPVNS